MIYEKPWNKEFTRLLAALEIALGGKIVEPEIDESYSWGYSSEVAYYNYSLLHAEIDNVGVRVEISHNEMAGAVLLDGSDQTAFLVVCALSHPQGFFRIRPEGVDVRLLKFIRIENEFDTSNPDFNDALFLEVSDNKAKRLLQRADLQEMILALLPFDSLQAHSKGLRYSELLTQKEQLDREYVISTLKQLVALAQVIESPVWALPTIFVAFATRLVHIKCSNLRSFQHEDSHSRHICIRADVVTILEFQHPRSPLPDELRPRLTS